MSEESESIDDLNRIIKDALFGTSTARKRSLSQIVEWVDHNEWMFLTYEEMLKGLREGVQSGVVGQDGLEFFLTGKTRKGKNSRGFIEFSRETYRQACDDYSQRFDKAYKEMKMKERPRRKPK